MCFVVNYLVWYILWASMTDRVDVAKRLNLGSTTQ